MPNPGRPSLRQEAPPPRAPSYRPNGAQSQITIACAQGLVPGLHARNSLRTRKTGSRLRPPAPRMGGCWSESAQPQKSLTEARRER